MYTAGLEKIWSHEPEQCVLRLALLLCWHVPGLPTLQLHIMMNLRNNNLQRTRTARAPR